MSTIYPAASLFQINGVVDTNKTAMQNLTTLANACGCWVTYDIAEGRWSVIINEDSSPVANFDDSNIIGGISISGSGINDMYNQGTIEFPHKDLRDQTDYIDLDVDLENRFPNELDNKLSMSLQCINDPIQAQYILNVEMKQSRLDKVISFRTDYTKVGLKAGDIVTVTSDVYGYSSKRFRIITVQEEDDNGITISITAKEHDSSLYSTDGLTRKERNKKTGIVPKATNVAVMASDAKSFKVELTQNAREHGLVLYYLQGAKYNIWRIGYNEGTMVNINAASANIEWYFRAPGKDLDIRAKIVSPNVGQTTYVGYRDTGQIDRWPASGTAYLIWAGDNEGTGTENCAVNIEAIKNDYPSTRYIVVECRAIWGTDEIGAHPYNPVYLKGTIWEGGSPVDAGTYFINPTAQSTASIEGVYMNINHSYIDYGGDGNVIGDLMGYMVFDTVDQLAYFSQTIPT